MRRFVATLLLILLAVVSRSPFSSAQSTLRGVIFSISPGPPPRLVLNIDRQMVPITLTSATRIQIRNEAGQLVTFQFSDLQVGDEVVVTIAANNETTAVLVVGRTLSTPLPTMPGATPSPPATSPLTPSPRAITGYPPFVLGTPHEEVVRKVPGLVAAPAIVNVPTVNLQGQIAAPIAGRRYNA